MPGPNPFSGNTPRTPFGTTGLGAVGGARGVGAVSLRILAEFITTYDADALEKLAQQLEAINAEQAKNTKEIAALEQQRVALQKQLTDAQDARKLASRAELTQLKEIQKAYVPIIKQEELVSQMAGKRGVVAERERLAQMKANLANNESYEKANKLLSASSVLTQDVIDTLLHKNQITQQEHDILERIRSLKALNNQLDADSNAINQQGVTIAEAKAQVLPRIGAAALGLVGGVVGGALVGGLVLGPLQEAIDTLGKGLEELVNPAKKAQEAIKDLGKEVNSLIDDDTLTRLQAAKEYISEIQPPQARGIFNEGILGAAAQSEAFQNLIDKIAKYKDLVSGGRLVPGGILAIQTQQAQQLALLLVDIDRKQGNLMRRPAGEPTPAWAQDWTPIVGAINGALDATVDWNTYLERARDLLGDLDPSNIVDAEAAARAAADAFREWQQEIAATDVGAAFDVQEADIKSRWDTTIQGMRDALDNAIDYRRNALDREVQTIQDIAQNRIDALQKRSRALEVIPSARTRELEKQLQLLSDAGPSRRTKELADQIERINAASERRAYLDQLNEIHEERALLLLQRRLSFATTEINIDDYNGKKRLVAIDALIEREQQRQQLAQDFNKLLDIQYELNQKIGRNQGETIQDYLGRVAQRNRDLMNQLGQSASERRVSALEQLKADTQFQVDLQESLEKEKEVIQQRAEKIRLERLQRLLEASRKADQRALEQRRRILQEELAASRKADQQALEDRRQKLQDEIDAVRRKADADIREAKRQADEDIKNSTRATNARIADAEKQRDKEIDAAEEKKKALIDLASDTATQQKRIQIQGATDATAIARIAGAAAGSEQAYQTLLAEIKALNLPESEARILLANAADIRAASLRRLYMLVGQGYDDYSARHPTERPYAKGGIFALTNSMNFGDNMRAGEEGTELGVVLSNNVVKALERNTGMNRPSMNIQAMNINRSDDPYRDRYMFRKEIRKVLEELVH